MPKFKVKLEFETKFNCHPDNVIPFAVEELLEILQDFRESDPTHGNDLKWTVEPVTKQK